MGASFFHVDRMRVSQLGLFLLIGFFLLAGELALEFRANRRGFPTLFFRARVTAQAGAVEAGSPVFGPSDDFPFRSRIVDPAPTRGIARIWIASSSYAEDTRHTPDQIFPHLVGEFLADSFGISAEVLNASRSGLTIQSNTDDLASRGATWHPDVVVLYQLTNDLTQLSATYLGGRSVGRVLEAEPAEGAGVENPSEFLGRTYESTTLYAQLSSNLTPRVMQYSMLPSEMPSAADSVFTLRVRAFIAQVRELGALPVLTTFAGSHTGAGAPIPWAPRAFMLRFNPYQSPEGYLETVDRWNGIVRVLAAEEGVPLIDMDRYMGGRSGEFRDFAHLTERGHGLFAGSMGARLAAILTDNGIGGSR